MPTQQSLIRWYKKVVIYHLGPGGFESRAANVSAMRKLQPTEERRQASPLNTRKSLRTENNEESAAVKLLKQDPRFSYAKLRARWSQMPLRLALAILAFLIYGFGVLSLHPERHSRWLVEADFSLAAAVSYSVYGTPLGMANANVAKLFRNVSRQDGDDRISVQKAMARTVAGDIPAGDVLKASNDGNGAGYPIFASLAMRLLGPHLSALIYSFLLMMGISTLIFISRFQDDRLFMVPLQFFALTLMLLSPLASNTLPVDQSPIGGLRYFSVAGILPALHIFFEVTDRSWPAARAVISNFILLGLQVFIFAFVMFARGSVGYLLAPILLGVLFGIWSNRRSPVQLREIISKAGFTMVAGIAFVSIITTTVPSYDKTGRLFGTIWHRAFVSFGLHRDWPFGNLRQVYDCADVIPKGLQRYPGDQNAHCVFWSTYPPAVSRKLSDEEISSRLLGGDYEKELQSAFFNVVFSYPRQVLELYVYYKSAMILWALREALDFGLSAQTAKILALAALQFMVFVVFVGWGAYRGSSEITPRAAGSCPPSSCSLFFPFMSLLAICTRVWTPSFSCTPTLPSSLAYSSRRRSSRFSEFPRVACPQCCGPRLA